MPLSTTPHVMTTDNSSIPQLVVGLPEELRAHVAGYAWTLDDAVEETESLALVRLLHRYHAKCTFRAMNKAAGRGLLDIVRFLHVHRSEGCSSLAMILAAARGHLRIVQFLHRFRHEGCTAFAIRIAAANGHLKVITFLHQHNVNGFSSSTIDKAAANGHVEMVRYLLANRNDGFSVAAIDRAIEHGYDEIVELLLDDARRNGRRAFTKLGIQWAVRNNHKRLAERLLCGTTIVDAIGRSAPSLC